MLKDFLKLRPSVWTVPSPRLHVLRPGYHVCSVYGALAPSQSAATAFPISIIAGVAVSTSRRGCKAKRRRGFERLRAIKQRLTKLEDPGLPPELITVLMKGLSDQEQETHQVLIMWPQGNCTWHSMAGSSEAKDAGDLAAIEASSVGEAALAAMLPLPGLGPAQLLAMIRHASRVLRVEGRLFLVSTWGPSDGPFCSFLGSPDLCFRIEVQPPCQTSENKVWTYVCTRHGADHDLLPGGTVRLMLEAGRSSATGASSDLAVWTPNAKEALYEYEEIFCKRVYGPKPQLDHVFDIAPSWGGLQPTFFEIGKEKAVIDAGLNLGMFCLHLQKQVPKALQMVCLAFEPAPDTFKMAVQTLREAGIHVVDHGGSLPSAKIPPSTRGHPGMVVHAFQMALSSSSCKSQGLRHFPKSPANSGLVQHKPEQRWSPGKVPDSVELQVSCCRLSDALDAMFGKENLPELFLKIDVEGAEVELLEGIEARHWASVHSFALEVQDCDGRLEKAIELCERQGFCGVERLQCVQQPTDAAASASSRVDSEDLYMVYGCRR
eukprot:TRINITY_DN60783_c0_g1_i1.p1 TRINITY_DN60783_c0_g1~~TRINITY_DN60783_c0_g1_i1.p1  ORF type:complete len:547 (+),score=82.91 TRINITY_DN60783_c0_g1_i1:49-1689(+)